MTRVMRERGYPIDDFDQRAADISVDHPDIVENYRSAHAIYLSQQNGEINTEDARQAFVHYRALFDRLLGSDPEPQHVNDEQRRQSHDERMTCSPMNAHETRQCAPIGPKRRDASNLPRKCRHHRRFRESHRDGDALGARQTMSHLPRRTSYRRTGPHPTTPAVRASTQQDRLMRCCSPTAS